MFTPEQKVMGHVATSLLNDDVQSLRGDGELVQLSRQIAPCEPGAQSLRRFRTLSQQHEETPATRTRQLGSGQ